MATTYQVGVNISTESLEQAANDIAMLFLPNSIEVFIRPQAEIMIRLKQIYVNLKAATVSNGGSITVPSPSHVWDGAPDFGPSDSTAGGTLVLPNEADVREGTGYGVDGNGSTGTLVVA
jgi:hypothetical protein